MTDPNNLVIEYGGEVRRYEFVLWPAFGSVSLLGFLPFGWAWATWIFVAVGALLAGLLLLPIVSGALDSRAWIEGARIQLPLFLASHVLGVVSTFGLVYGHLQRSDERAFSESLSAGTAIIYSAATWLNGDQFGIVAQSGLARTLSLAEMYVGALTLLVILATAVAKAFESRSQR